MFESKRHQINTVCGRIRLQENTLSADITNMSFKVITKGVKIHVIFKYQYEIVSPGFDTF